MIETSSSTNFSALQLKIDRATTNPHMETLDMSIWKMIYTLRHTIVRDGDEDHKEIGNYSSEELAKQAIERVKDKPGFRDPRGYFTIGPSRLDFDYWADGFGPGDDDN